jgi:hypothetical protein
MNRPARNWKIRSAPAVLAACLLASCGSDRDEAMNGSVAGAGRTVAVTLAEARQEAVRVELFSVGRIVSRNMPRLAAEISGVKPGLIFSASRPVSPTRSGGWSGIATLKQRT